ncbi:MAG: hypothetical protein HFJ49_00010 [Clostridia bacterium]|nr:hypothetical protein [Clostridia bacterium]
MEVRKCLEYYFDKDTTKEEIMKYLKKNINELKKISKIKETNIDIIQNEYEVKKATLTLTIKRKNIKKQRIKLKQNIKTEEQKMKRKDKSKINKKQDQKENLQRNQIIKIDTAMPVKKYGIYKNGGQFVPYQEKVKGKG